MTTASPEAASTTTRPLAPAPSFGASDALRRRGAPITRKTSVPAATDSRSAASVRLGASGRAARSRSGAASCASSSARCAARRDSRARNPAGTSPMAAATDPARRQRPAAAAARAAASRRTSARSRARRSAGGGAACASASASSAASSSSGSSKPIGRSSATGFPPGEGGAQPLHTVADACLHGTERRAVPRRDLAMREALEVRGLDRSSLLMGQSIQRRPHPRGALPSFYGLIGTFGWNQVARRGRAAPLGLAACHPRASAVEGDVANDTEKPGTHRAARRLVAPRATPDAQERLLDGVLRELAVRRDPQRDPVGERREPVVQRGQRHLVATRDARQQSRLDLPGCGQGPASDEAARGELPAEPKADPQGAERGAEPERELGSGEAAADERQGHAQERAPRDHAPDRPDPEDRP